MNISTNSFGNYKPIVAKRTIQPPPVEDVKKTQVTTISNEEKKLFTKLYPDEKEQIENYHFYNREGNKNGVSLGSLFDRRG